MLYANNFRDEKCSPRNEERRKVPTRQKNWIEELTENRTGYLHMITLNHLIYNCFIYHKVNLRVLSQNIYRNYCACAIGLYRVIASFNGLKILCVFIIYILFLFYFIYFLQITPVPSFHPGFALVCFIFPRIPSPRIYCHSKTYSLINEFYVLRLSFIIH